MRIIKANRQKSGRAKYIISLLLVSVLSCIYLPLATAGPKASISPRTQQTDETYIIGPGDLLEIIVWKEPEISRTVRVRPDGRISLPLIDDIKVSQTTMLDVKRRITNALARYIDRPSVHVMLAESGSKKIYILGNVNAPGEYMIEKHITVLQAIARAGGFSRWADRDDIVIVRRGSKGQTRIEFDYGRVISGKALEDNVYLKADDLIIVP